MKMKKTIWKTASFYFVLMCIGTMNVQAQSADEKAIAEVFSQGEAFWNQGDIEGYVSLYAPVDSCRMILNKGAVYGKENILAFYKKYWPKERMGSLITDGMEYEKLSDKYYFVTGYFHVSYPDSKKIEGRFSVIMLKYNDKWYLYTDHSG
jgi:ketosteroid isomerase-like protein